MSKVLSKTKGVSVELLGWTQCDLLNFLPVELLLGNMFSEYLSCVDAWSINVADCQANTLYSELQKRQGEALSLSVVRKEAQAAKH